MARIVESILSTESVCWWKWSLQGRWILGLGGELIDPTPVLYILFLTGINSMVCVRERTIPTKLPPLVGEVTANFCG
jgi:hypothetical protein